MKYLKMKIRDHFIPLIKDGVKKHEYRLADPKYADIHIGDVLILVSKQNQENYIKVVVEEIEHFYNLKDALRGKWQDDFYGLFSTYEDVIKEFHRFYTDDEITQYGLNVYKISPYRKSFKKARFLLDTSIIIERESYNNVLKDVALVYAAIDKLSGEKFVHEKTIEEISKYSNEKIRDSILTKLNAYQRLISSSEKNEEFEKVCSLFSQDENSMTDNEILKQVFNGNVDFLITADQTIIRKAKQLHLDDSVFSPNSFLGKMDEYDPKLIDYDVLSINLVSIGSLDINDKFFDTLREDYEGVKFNNWLNRKSNDKAYVFNDEKGLQGFLYLKTEDEEEKYTMFETPFKPAKRLKIGTFKITKSGLRLGERFLKIVFDNALKRDVDEIYVTLFENKREEVFHLKQTLEEWGFVKTTKNKENGEIVLVKDMRKYDDEKNPKFNYPLTKKDKKYMFLPILSKYHTKLFPDLYLKKEKMEIFDEAAYRYAIEKIYICGWDNINARPGDIVCIYRMGEYYKTYTSVVSGIGILQEIIYPINKENFIEECKNKSIFSKEELEKFYKSGKYRTIVKILYLKGFNDKINLNNLYKYGIIERNGPGPRINTFISEDSFNKLNQSGKE